MLALLAGLGPSVQSGEDYNPLPSKGTNKVETLDMTVFDRDRNRDIPIRIYLPASNAAQPLRLFSHGLGGSRKSYSYLGSHWAANGYLAVLLQHPGSDIAVWQNTPAKQWLHGKGPESILKPDDVWEKKL